jgi:hypothetical protein
LIDQPGWNLSSQEEVAKFYQEYLGALSIPIDSAAGSSLSISLSSGSSVSTRTLLPNPCFESSKFRDGSLLDRGFDCTGGRDGRDAYRGEMKRYESETADLYAGCVFFYC